MSSPDISPLSIHPTLPAFTDKHGRQLLLRGLNVSGDAKVPMNPPLAGTPEFYDVSQTTYTGRPFKDATEASEWLHRLKTWGVTIIRLVVCWEALEPREMGVYDDEYIASLHTTVRAAEQVGIYVFIDGHQDVWSRFTGGSGAPLWTFTIAGLDPRVFPDVCAAALDAPGTASPLSSPAGRLWPTNYSKFAVATMFTLFFAGEVFAPSAVWPETGENVGAVLRRAYIAAYARLMRELVDCKNVVGIDPMNEPHHGYIGQKSLKAWNENTELHLGWMPSGFEGMALAGGEAVEVGYWQRSWPHPSYRKLSALQNASRTSAWLPSRPDIWKTEGVYHESGKSGKDTYFTTHPTTGNLIDFEADFYVPFLTLFHDAMPPGLFSFLEPIPNQPPPTSPSIPRSTLVYAPHWYDIRTIYEKALSPALTFDVLSLAAGSRNIPAHTYLSLKNNYTTNFRRLTHPLHPTPVLIGETGVPMDLNRQCIHRGHTAVHEKMTDAILSAMERNLLSWTWWNLTLSHRTSGSPPLSCDNQTLAPFQSGDGWNSEDLSIVDGSGELRLPRAMVRPYPLATAGTLLQAEFGMRVVRLEMKFLAGKEGREVGTEVFLPGFWKAEGVVVRSWVDGLGEGVGVGVGVGWDQRIRIVCDEEVVGREVTICVEYFDPEEDGRVRRWWEVLLGWLL